MQAFVPDISRRRSIIRGNQFVCLTELRSARLKMCTLNGSRTIRPIGTWAPVSSCKLRLGRHGPVRNPDLLWRSEVCPKPALNPSSFRTVNRFDVSTLIAELIPSLAALVNNAAAVLDDAVGETVARVNFQILSFLFGSAEACYSIGRTMALWLAGRISDHRKTVVPLMPTIRCAALKGE